MSLYRYGFVPFPCNISFDFFFLCGDAPTLHCRTLPHTAAATAAAAIPPLPPLPFAHSFVAVANVQETKYSMDGLLNHQAKISRGGGQQGIPICRRHYSFVVVVHQTRYRHRHTATPTGTCNSSLQLLLLSQHRPSWEAQQWCSGSERFYVELLQQQLLHDRYPLGSQLPCNCNNIGLWLG